MAVKRTMYQRKVDVDMLNAVKSVLADVSSVSPLSEQRGRQADRQAGRWVDRWMERWMDGSIAFLYFSSFSTDTM